MKEEHPIGLEKFFIYMNREWINETKFLWALKFTFLLSLLLNFACRDINEQGLEMEGHFTNNVSERHFRILKSTICRQRVLRTIPDLIYSLTTSTQGFYENRNLEEGRGFEVQEN